ncbi:MAG: hypothetical protein AMXMBFR64_57910 [Myxococcales bacterium]
MTDTIQQLVERRVREWEARQTLAGQPTPIHPVITISRLCGAGGLAIGQAVAERLDFALYDKQIVEGIAQNARVLGAVVESVDERTRNAIEAGIAEILTGSRMSYDEYLSQLSRVVLTLVRHGRAVLVGRGAHHIVEPRARLAVRVVAPLDLRIKRRVSLTGVEWDEAAREVERTDKGRSDFIRRHFQADDHDPLNYDLTVNTAQFSIEQAADLVVQTFRARFGDRR